MTSKLTPADLGILAAAFDDARMRGFGDDDSLELLTNAAIYEAGIAEADAYSVAYDFFRAQFA